MLAKLRPRSVYDVLAVIGCFAGLTTGGAYAADTIGSSDVINESLLSEDFKNGEVKNSDIKNGSVTSLKINNGSVLNAEIGANAVDTARSRTARSPAPRCSMTRRSAVASAPRISPRTRSRSLRSRQTGSRPLRSRTTRSTPARSSTFSSQNQDVGVLFAQVNANGTIANSSGAVTGSRRSAPALRGRLRPQHLDLRLRHNPGRGGRRRGAGAIVGVDRSRRERRGRVRDHSDQRQRGRGPCVPAGGGLLGPSRPSTGCGALAEAVLRSAWKPAASLPLACLSGACDIGAPGDAKTALRRGTGGEHVLSERS